MQFPLGIKSFWEVLNRSSMFHADMPAVCCRPNQLPMLYLNTISFSRLVASSPGVQVHKCFMRLHCAGTLCSVAGCEASEELASGFPRLKIYAIRFQAVTAGL